MHSTDKAARVEPGFFINLVLLALMIAGLGYRYGAKAIPG